MKIWPENLGVLTFSLQWLLNPKLYLYSFSKTWQKAKKKNVLAAIRELGFLQAKKMAPPQLFFFGWRNPGSQIAARTNFFFCFCFLSSFWDTASGSIVTFLCRFSDLAKSILRHKIFSIILFYIILYCYCFFVFFPLGLFTRKIML